MLASSFDALSLILDPSRLVFMFLGISVGLVVGILPGLGGGCGHVAVVAIHLWYGPSCRYSNAYRYGRCDCNRRYVP